MRSATRIVGAVALLSWPGGSASAAESCTAADGTAIPRAPIITGQLNVGSDLVLWNNMWGMRGHEVDGFEQCIFTSGAASGWTWTQGTTDPACSLPPCPAPACMHEFSIGQLNYGVSPHGQDTGTNDMPVSVGTLGSLVGTHDVTYLASDDNPGLPTPFHPRYSLIYDLFLTRDEPAPGQDVSASITDEVIVRMNYNPEHTDLPCSSALGAPIEPNAVFDGFHWYDYHSFSDQNSIGTNFHDFRRVGGDLPGAAVPTNLDVAPFLFYVKQRYAQPDLWLGQIVIGGTVWDHTTGSATFNSSPSFAPTTSSDSDGDGLNDAQEVFYGTDPGDTDSDDDGSLDGAELAAGSDPLDPLSAPPATIPSTSNWGLLLLSALLLGSVLSRSNSSELSGRRAGAAARSLPAAPDRPRCSDRSRRTARCR